VAHPLAERPQHRRGALAIRLGPGDEPLAETRPAVVGSTEDDAEPHFLGWLDDVDPDELFASGTAWGIKVVRRPA